MRSVSVTSVIKDPNSNSEVVTAVGVGSRWGTIKKIEFVSPEGKHKIGQAVEIEDIAGTLGYGS